MNSLPDYYAELGVPVITDRDGIRQAYRRLALKHHPDRGGSHEMMLRLNEAFGILGNPANRGNYDQARTHAHDAKFHAQAESDSRTAAAHATEYPQNYGEFEKWVDGFCADFTGARYGQDGYFPSAEKSTSAQVFMVVGAAATAVGFFVAFGEAYANWVRGTAALIGALMVLAVGAWLGRFVHQVVGTMVGKPVSQSNSKHHSTPSPDTPTEPAQSSSSARNGSLIGRYQGTCTNTSFDPPLTGQVTLELQSATASMVEGSLELSNPLSGGSKFIGVIEGDTVRFQTAESGLFLIEWRGAIDGRSIVGDYIVRTSDPILVNQGLSVQNGVWRCTKETAARN